MECAPKNFAERLIVMGPYSLKLDVWCMMFSISERSCEVYKCVVTIGKWNLKCGYVEMNKELVKGKVSQNDLRLVIFYGVV